MPERRGSIIGVEQAREGSSSLKCWRPRLGHSVRRALGTMMFQHLAIGKLGLRDVLSLRATGLPGHLNSFKSAQSKSEFFDHTSAP